MSAQPEGTKALEAGVDLTAPIGATLPKRCVKCGTYQGLELRSQLFHWTPTWAAPLVWVPYSRWLWARTARLEFYVCSDCARQWNGADGFHLAAVVVAAAPLVLAKLVHAGFLLLFLPAAAAALYLTRYAARKRQIYPRFIALSQEYISVGGVHPDVAGAWRAREGRGRHGDDAAHFAGGRASLPPSSCGGSRARRRRRCLERSGGS